MHEEDFNTEDNAVENTVDNAVENMEDAAQKAAYQKGVIRGALIVTAVVAVMACITVGAVLFVHFRAQKNTTTGTQSSVNLLASNSNHLVSEVLSNDVLAKIRTIVELLDTNYYDEVDAEELIDGLYHGVVDGLGDPYTDYLSVDELTQFTDYVENQIYGIGVTFTMDEDTGFAYVLEVYEDSPAEEAGILAGDLISEVDGNSLAGLTTEEAAGYIRGEDGSVALCTILRDGETMEVEVTRGAVHLKTADGIMLHDGIGYVAISKFSEETADEFKEVIDALNEEGLAALVIDLRDNVGGRVDSCLEALDYILPEGTLLTMKSKYTVDQSYQSDAAQAIDVPVVVLIDGETASAGEIFAIAMK